MPIKVQSTQYIFPPRPSSAIPRDQTEIYAQLGWLAQYKYNDARCLIKLLPDHKVELWSRHAEKFRNYTAPDWLYDEILEVQDWLGLRHDDWHLLDGGLLDFKHEAIRDTIVIWDILVKNGDHLTGTSYNDRYNLLKEAVPDAHTRFRTNDPEGIKHFWLYNPPHGKHPPINFGYAYTEHIFLPENWQPKDWGLMWEVINMANTPYLKAGKGPVLEGMVIKDPNGQLMMGYTEKNNTDWMTRSRVTTGRHQF